MRSWDRYYLHEAVDASRDHTAQPGAFELQRRLGVSLVYIGLITHGLDLVYVVGFLRWQQATPGKLLFGLRVRLRAHPGLLAMSVIDVGVTPG